MEGIQITKALYKSTKGFKITKALLCTRVKTIRYTRDYLIRTRCKVTQAEFVPSNNERGKGYIHVNSAYTKDNKMGENKCDSLDKKVGDYPNLEANCKRLDSFTRSRLSNLRFTFPHFHPLDSISVLLFPVLFDFVFLFRPRRNPTQTVDITMFLFLSCF